MKMGMKMVKKSGHEKAAFWGFEMHQKFGFLNSGK